MKKYIYSIIIAAIISMAAVTVKSCKKLTEFRELYNIELNNVRAYEEQNSSLNSRNLEFRLTIDELRASRDSINNLLTQAVDKLKIKDKNVRYLQYQKSYITKIDTLIMKDTIFRNTAPLDTVIGDKWYSLDLKLRYPSTIITNPSFVSEKVVVIHTKKEYNKKPSKIFFIRWFQKKHTVTEVNIIENNPYIENRESKFIKTDNK